MKNLTTALRTGDLRPKERVMLQIHNAVAKDKTGKDSLTDADKHALGEGWRAKTNEEAREYNRYIEGWRLMNNAEIDAQTNYLSATVALLRARSLVDMSMSKDAESSLDFCKTIGEKAGENSETALSLILQNSGLELDRVVYRYAFESLSEDLKKDVLALYPDAKTESQYLDQEESIADAFNGKNTLTAEAKEKLADLIVKSMHNKYAAVFTKLGTKNEDLRSEYYFSGYYAELPALEILNKWAVYNNQMPKKADDLLRHIPEEKEYANDSEEVTDLFDAIKKELIPKLNDYAQKHHTSVGALLKQTLLKWLDEGLFTKDFTPIWNSDGTDTCNGIETKLPQKDVLKEWLKAKRKSEQTIQGLIDTGELKVEDRVETIKHFISGTKGLDKTDEDAFKRTLTLITGESLYTLAGDFAFASDYRKQADDLVGLGGLITFIRGRRFLDDYGILLAFVEFFERLSKSFEIDLTDRITSLLASFKDDIEMLNSELLVIGENVHLASYEKNDADFLIDIFMEDMLIDLENVKPNRGRAGKYFTDMEKALGDEF
jgi:hypothetical protein